MKKQEMPPRLSHTANAEIAAEWVRDLVRFIGPGFHPDSRFSDYVTDHGRRCFTPKESRFPEGEMKLTCEILEQAGIEIYAVALPVQHQMLGW